MFSNPPPQIPAVNEPLPQQQIDCADLDNYSGTYPAPPLSALIWVPIRLPGPIELLGETDYGDFRAL